MTTVSSNRVLWLMIAVILVIGAAAYVVYLVTTTATVQVRTTPVGVAVTVNGALAGTTSDSLLSVSVSPGPISLTLSRAGYDTVVVDFTVGRGEVYELDQVMRPPGMVFVRGGRFEMGDDAGSISERPAHPVRLRSYYIDRTEVTVDAFRRYQAGYSPEYAGADMPATNISWADADAYCRAKGKRLPTEAEWERACRGPHGRAYAYGDDYEVASARSGQKVSAGPAEVGTYLAGNAGAVDMTGNVWEWCSDWYGRDYYESSPVDDPKGPSRGRTRVLRGGAWFSNDSFSKCTHRPGNIRSQRDPSFGFRCARDLD